MIEKWTLEKRLTSAPGTSAEGLESAKVASHLFHLLTSKAKDQCTVIRSEVKICHYSTVLLLQVFLIMIHDTRNAIWSAGVCNTAHARTKEVDLSIALPLNFRLNLQNT